VDMLSLDAVLRSLVAFALSRREGWKCNLLFNTSSDPTSFISTGVALR
jgi:hypothetical protein